jgi:flagellar FliJ protein
MKRFRFPLKPVAVLRAHKEMRAREAFGAAVHAFVQSEENLAMTRQRVADLEKVLFAGRSDRFLAGDAASLYRVYRSECHSEMEAERAVITARDLMNQRRAEYLEANRQLKVVHKLEEKARERHRVEELRVEQNSLDEFAGYLASRKQPVLT